MSTGPKSGWGGRRPGSGRPRDTLTVEQVNALLRSAKKYAKKYGKTVDEILLDLIYSDDIAPTVRGSCIRTFKQYTVAPLKEGGLTDKTLGPSIYLPEEKGQVVELKKVS